MKRKLPQSAKHEASAINKRLGYQFIDLELLKLALTHRSFNKQHNERLEFLGDSILSSVIAEALYQKLPQSKEGQLSRLRSELVRKETLAAIGRQLNLGADIRIGLGEAKTGGADRDSILADALEAMIGAIFLDSDYQRVKEIILCWFGDRLENIHQVREKDAKSALQELLQSRAMPLPTYELISTKGEQHEQVFTVQCCTNLMPPVSGQGQSRRKAEQQAAENLLRQLQACTE